MCQFFSAIATRDGHLLFTEDDHHETTITRAGLRDGDLFLRHWVRVEQHPTETVLRVDETSIPAWFDVNEWQPRVNVLLARVRPAREAYDATVRSAQEACDAEERLAQEAFNAAERSAREAAREAYDATVRSALEAHDATLRSALEAYDAEERSAWEAYVQKLRTIEGYVQAARRQEDV